MIQIQKFGITALRVEEVFGFLYNVREEAQDLKPMEVGGDMPLVLPTLLEFERAVNEFDKALKESARLAGTSAKTIADENRDDAWRRTYAYLKAMEGSPDAATAEAATAARILFDKYKNPTVLPYTEETGILLNLVQDLEAISKADRDLLHLDIWVSFLKNANETFIAASQQVVEEKAARVIGIVKTTRQAAEKAYQKLVDVMNSLIIVEGEDYYKTFVEHLNVLIDEQRIVLRRRNTTNAQKNEKEEETES